MLSRVRLVLADRHPVFLEGLTHAIKEGRPDLELVGLWVHSADKAGKDAGEIAGIEPLGVAATNDADALLALDADPVVASVG